VKFKYFAYILIPTVLSLFILVICYPGFMSYDSIQMLEEARTSVNGGIFPTVPVYFLRLFDITGHGPTIMILAQNFILLLSLTLIIRLLGANAIETSLALIVFLLIPTVIGCMLVLWKDVTLVALIISSILLIFSVSIRKVKSQYFKLAKWSSLLLLLIATLVKFNAITCTVILVLYWIGVFRKNKSKQSNVIAFLLIVFSMIFSNKIVNGYTFPNFKKLQPNNIIYSVMNYDLVGISKWSRESLIPFDTTESHNLQRTPIEYIDAIYTSLGSAEMYRKDINSGNNVKYSPQYYTHDDLMNAWINAVKKYPLSYLKYRWDLFSEIIGATDHATFEPTHFNRIDENKFGITFKERKITIYVLKYIEITSGIFFGKPWFIFLLSSISVLIVYKSKIRDDFKKLAYYSFACAIMFIAPFFLITLSGEVRYSFTPIAISSIPIFVFLFSLNLD